MRILAVDPGPQRSAWVVINEDGSSHPLVVSFALEPNDDLLARIREQRFCSPPLPMHCAMEMVASYGMPVGREVFDTVWWAGRFAQCFGADSVDRIYRLQVKLAICKDSRAKDSNVRQAIIDRYPATGGGRVPQIGTKAKPGPLYGVRADEWAAIGVALTWLGRASKEN